jgi:hypothetical protein
MKIYTCDGWMDVYGIDTRLRKRNTRRITKEYLHPVYTKNENIHVIDGKKSRLQHLIDT